MTAMMYRFLMSQHFLLHSLFVAILIYYYVLEYYHSQMSQTYTLAFCFSENILSNLVFVLVYVKSIHI